MKHALHTVHGCTCQRRSHRTYTHAVCMPDSDGFPVVHRWSQSHTAALQYGQYLINKGRKGVEIRPVTRVEEDAC